MAGSMPITSATCGLPPAAALHFSPQFMPDAPSQGKKTDAETWHVETRCSRTNSDGGSQQNVSADSEELSLDAGRGASMFADINNDGWDDLDCGQRFLDKYRPKR